MAEREPATESDVEPEVVPDRADPDAPEADAIEQAQPVAESATAPERPHIGFETPEADAIEQAQPSPYDEDDRPM